MQQQNGVSHWLVYALVFLGSAVGTCGFFGLAFLTFPNPVSDALRSSIATMGREPEKIVKIAEVQRISELIQSGYVLTTNDLLSNMASYYGTLVTVLLGLIGLIAAGAYLTIRGNSMMHAEETLQNGVELRTTIYFDSAKFSDLVNARVSALRSIDTETRSSEIEEMRASIEQLEEKYEGALASLKETSAVISAEEPEDTGAEETAPQRPPRRNRTNKAS